MLLQSLYQLAEALEERDELPPRYHKEQKIRWLIHLDMNGEVEGLTSADDAKELAPYFKRSGSGSNPLLLVDKYAYTLGIEPDDAMLDAATGRRTLNPAQSEKKQKKLLAYLEGTQDLVRELTAGAEESKAPYAAHYRAVLMFLESEEQRWEAFNQSFMGKKPKASDNFCFVIDGERLHRTRFVRTFWANLREETNAERSEESVGTCMLTGQEGPIALVHPTEMRLGPDRVSLVSANSKAFESYGLRNSAIAPMGLRPAKLYGEALNHLLSKPTHRYRLGEATYVFWRKSMADPLLPQLLDAPSDILGDLFLEAHVDESDVRLALNKLFGGGELTRDGGLDVDLFYGVALTANKARLVVRDLTVQSVSDIIDRLATWFDKQALVDARDPARLVLPLGVFKLAASTCRDVKKDLSPRVLPFLVRAALTGERLPLSLMRSALQRAATDHRSRLPRARAVLVRMILNDHLTQGDNVPPRLDLDDHRPGYLCGRLLATLEDAQHTALGYGINTTVTDRFYGTASSAPGAVFPRLMRGLQAHLQKARRDRPGAHVRIQKEVEQIMSGLTEFPRTLNLVEQGLFAMGYYHQRAEFQRRIQENRKDANT